ncbi:unnamed protein product [Moneuplotes crassus]|uniref:EF-hand domain-containing protein n=1 Tax=Euplotes crassus TaxID=5936 RepID=A0AAD1Y0V0_EUPCR|nr:unnamed protein product [Moneuplotes crassus]
MEADLTEDQIDEFKEVFELFDVDAGGRVTYGEIKRMVKGEWGLQGKEPGDHEEVDFPTYLSIMAKGLKQADPKEELLEAFKCLFDKDSTGFISPSEAIQILKTYTPTLTPEEIEEIVLTLTPNLTSPLPYQDLLHILYPL